MAQEVVVTAIGSPIPHTLYPLLAVLLLIVGLVLTAAFFIYEATTSKFSRSLSREFATGGVASLFLVCNIIFSAWYHFRHGCLLTISIWGGLGD
jgi:hypothetical protein